MSDNYTHFVRNGNGDWVYVGFETDAQIVCDGLNGEPGGMTKPYTMEEA